jgi:uncharacterized protein with GYD domain
LQGPVAQSGSAPRSHRGGQGFKSPQVHRSSEPLSEKSGRGSLASYRSGVRQLLSILPAEVHAVGVIRMAVVQAALGGEQKEDSDRSDYRDVGERRTPMPKYLFRAKLTVDGLKGLLKEGAAARREVVERMVQSLDGRLESIYWAFGEDDVYVTVEMPDNTSAAAMGLVTSAAGGVRTSTVVLLTPEEIDEAVRRQVEYRAPGA